MIIVDGLLLLNHFADFPSCFCSSLCGAAMMNYAFVQKNFTGLPRKMKLQSTI